MAKWLLIISLFFQFSCGQEQSSSRGTQSVIQTITSTTPYSGVVRNFTGSWIGNCDYLNAEINKSKVSCQVVLVITQGTTQFKVLFNLIQDGVQKVILNQNYNIVNNQLIPESASFPVGNIGEAAFNLVQDSFNLSFVLSTTRAGDFQSSAADIPSGALKAKLSI